jgi:hypothetical protein
MKLVTLPVKLADDGSLRRAEPEIVSPFPSKVMFLLLGRVTVPLLQPLPVHEIVSPELALVSAVLTVVALLQLVLIIAALAGGRRQMPNRSKTNNVLNFTALFLRG